MAQSARRIGIQLSLPGQLVTGAGPVLGGGSNLLLKDFQGPRAASAAEFVASHQHRTGESGYCMTILPSHPVKISKIVSVVLVVVGLALIALAAARQLVEKGSVLAASGTKPVLH